jgi:hypothetical protein
MPALTAGKIAEVMFESALETFESQQDLVSLCNFLPYDGKTMQRSGNVIWRPVQQHANVVSGWDLTGEETGIIEEEYPAILGTPSNDLIEQRVDDLRDMTQWERRGTESGRKQASTLNDAIATAIKNQGSLFYRSNDESGFDFISEGQVIMNERQGSDMGRNFLLNDRDSRLFAKDLAARQTLQGRPEQTWSKGQVGQNIAQFDGIYTGSFLPNLVGGADPATTVTGDHTFGPESGSVNTSTGVVTNVDYRVASIIVADSSSYNVGDKVVFKNAAVPVYALGLDNKQSTGQAMTFTIVEVTDATHVKVYPKPIAYDDAALSDLEKQYANIDTQILNAATVNRLNLDASNRANLFWDKSAVEVLGGSIPADLFQNFAGLKVISETLKNGLTMYMIYDGNMIDMSLRCRIFVWYGITVAAPANCGVAVTY